MGNDALDFQVGQATNTIIIDGATEYPAHDVCADRTWCVTLYVNRDAANKDLPKLLRRHKGKTFRVDGWFFTERGVMDVANQWRNDWKQYGAALFDDMGITRPGASIKYRSTLYPLESVKSC